MSKCGTLGSLEGSRLVTREQKHRGGRARKVGGEAGGRDWARPGLRAALRGDVVQVGFSAKLTPLNKQETGNSRRHPSEVSESTLSLGRDM